ncbi:lymphocyte function-associated antigen 3-like [Centropristis striata]|uniref:lymphocyte function-associated antigen 3-like n=1 Tax=Centropristis striata TaxID=184440 RepID=UPI0027E02617|nr:lymphocyte function-associated antigen 3-like [Centropristis striata]
MARWCFLACFICTSCLVAGQSTTKYALKGQDVSFKTDNVEKPDEILWKRNGNKVVEFDGKEQTVFKAYENRITLDWHSAELNITKLRYEDSGEYELEAELNKGLHRSLHNLQVIVEMVFKAAFLTLNKASRVDSKELDFGLI